MLSKSGLAVELSKLKAFIHPKVKQEQYTTDSEPAAEVLHSAYMNHDIKNKIIADLGCGTGILGIGCLLLEAGFVYFVDNDKDVLEILKENLKKYNFKNYKIINKDIKDFNEAVDIVMQNPPFGTKVKHSDKIFLEKAFSIAKVIYSFHKTSTLRFIEAVSKDNKFKITNSFDFNFPLKQTYEFHKKKIKKIEVSCYRLEKVLI